MVPLFLTSQSMPIVRTLSMLSESQPSKTACICLRQNAFCNDIESWNIRTGVHDKIIASAGNRTRAARVAGEHSTTEPPMQTWWRGTKRPSRLVLKLNSYFFFTRENLNPSWPAEFGLSRQCGLAYKREEWTLQLPLNRYISLYGWFFPCRGICLFFYLNGYRKKQATFAQDEVAEWLRRWTANPLGSARVGSNPILVDAFNGKHLGGVLNRYQYSTDR